MEKILVIFSGKKIEAPFIDFACYLSGKTASKLTGVFIENPYELRVATSDMELDYCAESSPRQTSSVVRSSATMLEHNIGLFQRCCQQKGVACEVYKDRGEPIQEVLEESRFADLIIVDPHANYYEEEEGFPSHFVKKLLVGAACPIVLAPEDFEAVEELAFCFDGSDSSLFAIKQFTYLFPGLNQCKVIVLQVQPPHQETMPDDHTRVMDWVQDHYLNFSYKELQGRVNETLFRYLFGKRKMMVVMGAYGRSMLSNFFHQSDSNMLIRSIDLPLFIAHN